MRIILFLAAELFISGVGAASSTTIEPATGSTITGISSSSSSTNATTASVSPTTPSSTSAPCQDDPNTDCTPYKSLCQNGKYVPLLEKYCPKFCGYCGGGTTNIPSTCIDTATNCQNWAAKGYCTNSFYLCKDRKANCAKTCNLCDTVC